MNNQKNIIILGGGFGGLTAALELSKLLPKNTAYHVTVIDRDQSQTYHPLLYEVASGPLMPTDQEAEERRELALASSIAYRSVFKKMDPEKVEFARGEVEKIDRQNKEVLLKSGQTVAYEYLLLALGSATDFFGIDGLEQYAIPLKTTRDGLRIRAKVEQCIADIKHRNKVSFNIVIGGGGPTGVELAAELGHYFWRLVHKGVLTSGAYSITLVEGSSRVLSMCPPKVSKKVLHRLEHLGVRVLLDTCLKKAEATGIIIAPRPLRSGETEEMLLCDFRGEKEKRLDSDITVWAGGIRASEVLKESGFVTDQKGRVEINEYCEVKNEVNIFAIGDCALFQNEKKEAIPALAQSAIEEARIAAHNIFAEAMSVGKKRLKFRFYQTLVPVGGKYAIFVGKRLRIYGFLPWIVRELVNLRYFMSIMPRREALIYWLRGMDTYSQND